MKQAWKNLSYCLYFTARDIQNLMIDEKSRKEVLDYYSGLRPSKAYLECAHTGIAITLKELQPVIESIKKAGIIPCGAILPTYKFGPLCYNNPEHVQSLKKQTVFLAKLFNEIIIDDWLFSTCTCPKCVQQRAQSTWADYRSQILPKASRKYILQAARQANPKVKVIIKFPNWYEGYHHNGYNLTEQIRQFPEYCTGIETRGVTSHQQHIPIYTGYFLEKWLEKVDAKKHTSCWFDNWDLPKQPGEYIAQPYQGVLGGCREMVVWSAGTHYKTNKWSVSYRVLEKHLPSLDKLAGILPKHATGVPTYVPIGADGEYNIFGYLGMIGIPVNPVIEFPSKDPLAIFTLHSLKDAQLTDKILKNLMSGKTVVMTYGLFEKLRNTEIGNAFQIIETGGYMTPKKFRVTYRGFKKWSSEMINAGGSYQFKKCRLTTWPYVCNITGSTDDGDYPVVLNGRFLNGTISVLNVPENTHDLLKLPAEVLLGIRRIFCREAGLYIKGKSRIGLYVLNDGKMIVVYNMNDSVEKASVVLPPDAKNTKWEEIYSAKKLLIKKSDEEIEISMTLKPYELAVIKSKE